MFWKFWVYYWYIMQGRNFQGFLLVKYIFLNYLKEFLMNKMNYVKIELVFDLKCRFEENFIIFYYVYFVNVL